MFQGETDSQMPGKVTVHRVIVQCLRSDLDDDGGIDPVGERVPPTRSVWRLCWVFFGHANTCFLLASLTCVAIIPQVPLGGHTYYLTGLWILAQWGRQDNQN